LKTLQNIAHRPTHSILKCWISSNYTLFYCQLLTEC